MPDAGPRRGLTLLVPTLAGVVPLLAIAVAYGLNLALGDELEARFVCFPFTDGCVSVSRAARSGPGLHLFRALMLPCAVLLFLSWLMVREWLGGIGACGRARARLVFACGAVGAVFLVIYVAWLGTEGAWYHWLRRYGVTFYFAGTAFAQLLLVWLLWPLRRQLAGGRLQRPIVALTALVAVQWTLGVLSSLKTLVLSDADLIDRVENLIEWWYALPMALAFLVIARLFRRSGFQARFGFA